MELGLLHPIWAVQTFCKESLFYQVFEAYFYSEAESIPMSAAKSNRSKTSSEPSLCFEPDAKSRAYQPECVCELPYERTLLDHI